MSITVDMQNISDILINPFSKALLCILFTLISMVFLGYLERITYFLIVKSFKVDFSDECYSAEDLDEKKVCFHFISFILSFISYIPLIIVVVRKIVLS